MGYIYIKTSPNGKSYIGQTTRTLEERFKEHQKESSKCSGFVSAISKYGWDNFTTDYYECPDDELNRHERWLIRLMGTLTPDGYNLTEGGSSGKRSEETKKKISKALQGKTKSEETKKKLSEAQMGEKNHNFGKHPSDETKKKMSEAQMGENGYWYGKTFAKETNEKISKALQGKTKSEETKTKMSEAQLGEKSYWYGKTKSEETKKKMSEARLGDKNPNAKKVYQYTLDGKYINSFGSCGEAGSSIGKSKGSGNIATCARGEQKKAYDFRWSYEFHEHL